MEDEQHHRQGALHVIGAAAEQAVSVDLRLELVPAARDHVHVAVEHQRRDILGPHLRRGHRQPARLGLCRLDVVRLQPAADELRRALQPLGV